MSIPKLCVTHRGQAHADEFLACCLLFGSGESPDFASEAPGLISGVERRDCTQEDLDDPGRIVLDQGQQHDPQFLNFDHHQFERDHPACCGVTLILKPLLGIDAEDARLIWPWLSFTEWMDSKGPFQTGPEFGFDPKRAFEMQSPVETTVLRWFQSKKEIRWDSELGRLMARIGREKLEYFRQVSKRIEQIKKVVNIVHFDDNFVVLDVTAIDRADQPTLGLEAYIKQGHADDIVVVTVTQDDRGDGLCLFRRNDDPRVDFSQVEGWEGVLFAHKNGFVVKLHEGVDWRPILDASLTQAKT